MHALLGKLQAELFILNLRHPTDRLPQASGYRFTRLDDYTCEVEVTKNSGINGLFEALSRAGIEVISMRNKQNRLEQFFMDLVQGKLSGGNG